MNTGQMKMAHEYAILHLAKPENVGVEDSEIVAWAWDYVGLMQAEADKRKHVWLPKFDHVEGVEMNILEEKQKYEAYPKSIDVV